MLQMKRSCFVLAIPFSKPRPGCEWLSDARMNRRKKKRDMWINFPPVFHAAGLMYLRCMLLLLLPISSWEEIILNCWMESIARDVPSIWLVTSDRWSQNWFLSSSFLSRASCVKIWWQSAETWPISVGGKRACMLENGTFETGGNKNARKCICFRNPSHMCPTLQSQLSFAKKKRWDVNQGTTSAKSRIHFSLVI